MDKARTAQHYLVAHCEDVPFETRSGSRLRDAPGFPWLPSTLPPLSPKEVIFIFREDMLSPLLLPLKLFVSLPKEILPPPH